MRAPEFWDAPPGLAAALLAPLGAAWNGAAALRRALARPYRAPIPVVCVGNLVAGGSGKTPVVLSLLAFLADHHIAAHAVTRGHGGSLAGPLRVDPTRHNALTVGDEALLLAHAAPCWIARDRASGCRAAAAAGAGIIVLDDGFQNPGVAKDLSLVVIDAEYGFGNGRVIPAGPLREPVEMGLVRADAIVLIGDGEPPEAVRRSPLPLLRARFEPVNPARFRDTRVTAFAGIGRPAKFFASLWQAGAQVVTTHPYPDHHHFTPTELAGLRRVAARAGTRLVTTAKDWVRLPDAARGGIETFAVALRWRDPRALAELLAPVLRSAAEGRTKELVTRAAR
jgi:tetraacyldisaccharide 4'-kinase